MFRSSEHYAPGSAKLADIGLGRSSDDRTESITRPALVRAKYGL